MAGPIRIAVLANASQARRELNGVAQETSSLGSKIGKFGKAAGVAAVAGLAVAGAAAVKFGADSVRAASDAQQSLGATETVFGRFSDTVVRTSEKAATKYGISANVYRENANLLGSLFKNQGVSMDQLGSKTEGMIATAADLAATFGGTTTDAVEALGAAFKGEYDQLERYGISIKQSDVNARLAAQGQDTLTGAALKAAEQQAKSALIAEQAAQANGSFARESNTLAHQQQVLAAQFDNIKAKIGTALLPILTKLLTFVTTTVLPNFGVVREVLGQVATAFSPVVAFAKRAFAAFNGSDQAGSKMEELRATVKQVWGAIESIFSSAVSIIESLWRSFGSTIVSFAGSTFSNLVQIVRGALKVIQGIFNVVAGLIKGDWSRAWDGIKQIASGALSVVTGVVKQGLNIIRTAFSAVGTVLRSLWSGLWNAIKSLASNALGAVRGIVSSGWNALRALTAAAWNALRGVVSSAWGGIKRAVSIGIAGMLALVRAIPGRVVAALAGLASRLYNAGAEMMSMLAQGIRDKFDAAFDALKSAAGKLASLIPGSPVKEGPLRSLNAGHAGGEIMNLLAKGIKDNAAKPADELSRAMGRAREALVHKRDDLSSVLAGLRYDIEVSGGSLAVGRLSAQRSTARPAPSAAGVATSDRLIEEQTRLLAEQTNQLRFLVAEARTQNEQVAAINKGVESMPRKQQQLRRNGHGGRG